MNKTLLSILLCASAYMPPSAPAADTNETAKVNAIIGETLKVIEAEGWTPADVADAVKSLRGLYLRDTSTASGRERWHGKVVGLPVTDAARELIIREGSDPLFGARPLKRYIQSKVESLLARHIIASSPKEGSTLTVDADGDGRLTVK